MIHSNIFGHFHILLEKCYNKPYIESEYNNPFTNEHLHENFLYGSWPSFHYYDTIYQYKYIQSKKDHYIRGRLTISFNPIQFSLAPYVALPFRNNYI